MKIRGSRIVDIRNTAHGDDGKCILSICAFPICLLSAPLVHCSEVIFSELIINNYCRRPSCIIVVFLCVLFAAANAYLSLLVCFFCVISPFKLDSRALLFSLILFYISLIVCATCCSQAPLYGCTESNRTCGPQSWKVHSVRLHLTMHRANGLMPKIHYTRFPVTSP